MATKTEEKPGMTDAGRGALVGTATTAVLGAGGGATVLGVQGAHDRYEQLMSALQKAQSDPSIKLAANDKNLQDAAAKFGKDLAAYYQGNGNYDTLVKDYSSIYGDGTKGHIGLLGLDDAQRAAVDAEIKATLTNELKNPHLSAAEKTQLTSLLKDINSNDPTKRAIAEHFFLANAEHHVNAAQAALQNAGEYISAAAGHIGDTVHTAANEIMDVAKENPLLAIGSLLTLGAFTAATVVGANKLAGGHSHAPEKSTPQHAR